MHGAPWLVLLLAAAGALAIGPQTGWERPGAPMDKLYDKFFTELPSSSRCCVGTATETGMAQCYALKDTAPLYLIDTVGSWAELEGTGGAWTVVYDGAPDLLLNFIAHATSWTADTTVAGVLVKPLLTSQLDLIVTSGYSPLPQNPNAFLNLYNGTDPVWNPAGRGLWKKALPLIVLLSGDSQGSDDYGKAVREAGYNREKRPGRYEKPMRSAQYNYAMKAEGTTITECLNSRDCDLMGRSSYWASTALPAAMAADQSKVVAVMLPISGTSLFTSLSAPAQGAVVGTLVAALAVADAIAARRADLTSKQIMFFFFDAEDYGMAGSLRMLHDMQHLDCFWEPTDEQRARGYLCLNPVTSETSGNFTHIDPSNIEYIVSLDQLGVVEIDEAYDPANPPLFVKHDGKLAESAPAYNSLLVDAFVNNGAKRSDPSVEAFLPPSGSQSFLRIVNDSRSRTDLAAITLTGYDKSYNNKFYGSIYDIANVQTKARVNATLLLQSAETITKALWEVAGGQGAAPVVNATLLDTLFTCLTRDINCALVHSFLPSCLQKHQQALYQHTVNMYTGIAGTQSPVSDFIYRFLAQRFAVEAGSTLEQCDLESSCKQGEVVCHSPLEDCVPNLDNTTKGICMLSPVFPHRVVPLGIRQLNTNEWVVDSRFAHFEAWAESRWNSQLAMRFFTADSIGNQVAILFVGILLSIVSGIAVYTFRRHLLPKMKSE